MSSAHRQSGALPRHIAIIMDGNGRWATQKRYGRLRGHREGAKRVDEIVTECAELGVQFLTLYTFSTENWNRPASEVNMLMRLLVQHLRTMDKKLFRNKIQLTASGTLERLPSFVQSELARVRKFTQSYPPKLTLNLALSYGGRQELLDAFEKLARLNSEKTNFTEQDIQEALYQPHLPDPDLLIRTGGEWRISNFLLWQLAYSELYFAPVLWPDFKAPCLHEAIAEFGRRQRRFGKTSEQLLKSGSEQGSSPNNYTSAPNP